MSKRKEVLDAAAACVLQDRATAYGSVENNFGKIAALWHNWVAARYGGEEFQFDAVDVAAMMALVKMARLSGNPTHFDSWVDLAGYAACGAEVANG